MPTSDAAAYTRAVHQAKGLFASWPPMSDVKVGDFFELKGGVPRRLGNITQDEWGLTIETQPGTNPDATGPNATNWVAQSSDGVEVKAHLDAATPPTFVSKYLGKADLGLAIEFTGEGKFVLSMSEVSSQRIDNLVDLNRQLKKRWWTLKEGWDSKWIVATQVWSAQSATAVLSNATSNLFEFKLDAEVGPADPLAKLSTDFSLVGVHSGADTFTVKVPSTPLFEGARVSPLGSGPRPAFDIEEPELRLIAAGDDEIFEDPPTDS